MSKTPVFIVGSPRSGTSILVSALRNVGYEGYAEGNFLPLISIIGKAVDRHLALGKRNPNVMAGQIDADDLKTKIYEVLKSVTESKVAGPLWFDKSGNADMIRAIPVLRQLWPECVFIFAKRRAIENVVSRVKKFPGHNFQYHCADWSQNMSAWREMREQIPKECYLEVDQQDLIRDTELISVKLAEFLGLPPKLSVRLVKTFTSFRPQETDKGSAAKTYALDTLGWSEEQINIFRQHCGPEMASYGYNEGAGYDRDS